VILLTVIAFGLALTALVLIIKAYKGYKPLSRGRCATCQYLLIDLPETDEPRCPECGAEGDQLLGRPLPMSNRVGLLYPAIIVAGITVGWMSVMPGSPIAAVMPTPLATRMVGTWLDPLQRLDETLRSRQISVNQRVALGMRAIRAMERRSSFGEWDRGLFTMLELMLRNPTARQRARATGFSETRLMQAIARSRQRGDYWYATAGVQPTNALSQRHYRIIGVAQIGATDPDVRAGGINSLQLHGYDLDQMQSPASLRALVEQALATGPWTPEPPFDVGAALHGGAAFERALLAWLRSEQRIDRIVALSLTDLLTRLPDDIASAMADCVAFDEEPLAVDAWHRLGLLASEHGTMLGARQLLDRVFDPRSTPHGRPWLVWLALGSFRPEAPANATDIERVIALADSPGTRHAFVRSVGRGFRAMLFNDGGDDGAYRTIASWGAEKSLSADASQAEVAGLIVRFWDSLPAGVEAIVRAPRTTEYPEVFRAAWREAVLNHNDIPAEAEAILMAADPKWTSHPIGEGFARRFAALDDETVCAWAPHLRSRLEVANDEERERILRCLRHPAIGEMSADN